MSVGVGRGEDVERLVKLEAEAASDHILALDEVGPEAIEQHTYIMRRTGGRRGVVYRN